MSRVLLLVVLLAAACQPEKAGPDGAATPLYYSTCDGVRCAAPDGMFVDKGGIGRDGKPVTQINCDWSCNSLHGEPKHFTQAWFTATVSASNGCWVAHVDTAQRCYFATP